MTFIPERKLEAQKQTSGLQFRWQIKKSSPMLKWDCQHPNNTNLHSPFQLSPSHFSLFGSSVLSISAMWLTGVVGGLSWQPDPNTWPACSKAGSRKRTAHTGHHGNTPPRGPSAARPFPETLVPALWLDLANLLRLSLFFLLFTSLPPFCVLVCFTCVWVRVISRTRKAELPSSLWHVTVKSP